MLMREMPDLLLIGSMPYSPIAGWWLTPKSFGILGPVMSASMRPTSKPRFFSAMASTEEKLDFPTPPLPLMTTMMFLILVCFWASVSCCS